MNFLKQISRAFTRAIFLEMKFVTADGNKDVIIIGEYNPIIKLDTDFIVRIEKIEVEYEDEKVLNVRVAYTGIVENEEMFSVDYLLKTFKNRCFWQSDIKGQFIEHNKIRFVKVTQMEKWSNERFCAHFEATGHGRHINRRDSL